MAEPPENGVRMVVFLTEVDFSWETFFGTELACSYDMHFLKADGMWITIVRLKRWFVESFFKRNHG